MMAPRDGLIRFQDSNRILSKVECEAIARRVFDFSGGNEETRVHVGNWWQGELRWARNEVSLSSDRRDVRVFVTRFIHGVAGGSMTNQLDDISLQAAVRAAERNAMLFGRPQRLPEVEPPIPRLVSPTTAIWSDATYKLDTDVRGKLAQDLISPGREKGMLSAGYLEVRAGSMTELSSLRPTDPYAPWDMPYVQWTQGQCSMTVRDAEGTASGWAGLSSYNWNNIDPSVLGKRALEKCLTSRNPVALEPGRYTVILEPQAVVDLVELLSGQMGRVDVERDPDNPYWERYDHALELGRSKLGRQMLDNRITISHDPADPELGILPDAGMQPATWFDQGVLTNLAYSRAYALRELNANAGVRGMGAYRMSGGDSSIEDMIRSTPRGLLVTRFSDIRVLDRTTLLSTGLTRDGLWLIEHGKISKAVKNFRFTESPLFVLNSIEQLGRPVPVFSPRRSPYAAGLSPAIVPPIKARDFSFTSLIDAI